MKDKDYTVPSLYRGLSILEMFDSKRCILTQVEMAEALDVSPTSLYRIVQTLASMGYLKKVGTSTYELGSQVISRGFSYLASREIVEIAAPYITRLRNITSLSSHLAIRERTQSLYIFRALALQRISVNVPVGTRFPCHTTAMGRALLMGMSAGDIKDVYQGERIDGYPDPAPRTLPELISMCESERAQGWSIHYSDYSTAIAVPLCDFSGEVIAAINVSGPDVIMHKKGIQEELINALIETSKDIMSHEGR